MRIYDKIIFAGVQTTTLKNGSVLYSPFANASRHDLIKESSSGDHRRATPYRHIRVFGSGTTDGLVEKWFTTSRPPGSRYIFEQRIRSPAVSGFDSIPGVSYASENGVASLSLVMPQVQRTQADNRCLANLSDGKFKLGETLVELCETVSFVSSKAQHLLRVLVDLKHGRFSNALKQLGIRKSYMSRPLADRWLESQFAIKPLIGEFEQARKLVHSKTLGSVWYQISAKGTSTARPYVSTGKTLFRGTSKVRTHAIYQVNDYELRAMMALGLANPLELLWEFLPLSWLLDYVVGVGDYFANLLAPLGCTHISTSRSVRLDGDLRTNYRTVSTASGYRYTTTIDCVTYVNGYQRFPDIFAPVPTLEVKLPLNVNQLANIAALVAILRR